MCMCEANYSKGKVNVYFFFSDLQGIKIHSIKLTAVSIMRTHLYLVALKMGVFTSGI